MQQKNFLIFFALTIAILLGYAQLRQRLQGPPAALEKVDQAASGESKAEKVHTPMPAARGDGARLALGTGGALALPRAPVAAVRGDGARLAVGPLGAVAIAQRQSSTHVPAPVAAPPTDPSKLIFLGRSGDEGPSRFHLEADLDPRGAGVRRVVANKFAAADKQGRPEWKNEKEKIPKPLELVPEEANRDIPAFALYLYDPLDPTDDHPLDTLGKIVWGVAGDKNKPITEEKTPDGRLRQSVSFEAEVPGGVTITKTFSLTEGDYHLGLEVKLSKKEGLADTNDRPLRYQLVGGRGLPVEGEWYTSTFRNALIARVERGNVYRDLQDLRQISLWEGGNEVVRDKDRILRYAGIAVQYFASVIAVDDEQKHIDFLQKARPTLETAVTKGRVKSVASDKESLVLAMGGDRPDQTFYVPTRSLARERLEFEKLREGLPIAVVHNSDGVLEDGKLRAVAIDILPQAQTQPLFVDDITVRVSTEPIELKPGIEVVHKYILYNGPVKPMLLGQLTGTAAVPPEVVERYLDKLHLNTLTDYHSPGPIGTFASTIYWTQIIIKCTNLMHEGLNWLHKLIPNYGICIIVLTVLVRGMMFPVSRKQAMTSIRMQEVAPELKKLQEKFKDDKQQLGMAQMELYRKHGVNPFGSCWFLLLQMPIFMGLYYCLQESIHFRLAEFWPSWISNLAAPDMLIHWGEHIWYLSRPEDYGGILYLGPYFNLLPVIAVTLMIFQQKYTMPPPTDEQQEMQQKMMKYMMIFFGLMFYKVAAGLCVYFISSSVWGFTERKLLPKKKLPTGQPSAENLFQRIMKRDNGTVAATATGVTTSVVAKPGAAATSNSSEIRNSGKRRKGKKRREDSATQEAMTAQPGVRGWWQVRKEKLAAWWQELLRQAEKKR